jgi:hypothetical protein
MKLISIVSSAALAATLFLGAWSANAETTLLPSNETYIGSIAYTGGLMERAKLDLGTAQDIKYIRIDVPSFCVGEVFEAGTITEGVEDVATALGQNTFSVNDGRGFRAKGVFISVNGPASPGCNILVFKSERSQTPTPPTPPPPGTGKAYSCVTNGTGYQAAGNFVNNGWAVPFSLQPGQMMMLQADLLAGGALPNLALTFDADATVGYYPITVPVASLAQARGDCSRAPLYQFVLDAYQRRFNLIRVR